MELYPLYSVAGFLVGALVGMTGVGGGSLMTPMLILVFGIDPATAVGTDLLYAAVTKTAGTVVHGVNRNIDWRVAGRLALGSVPTALLMLLLLSHLDIYSPLAHRIITAVLGGCLLLTAAMLILRDRIRRSYLTHVSELGHWGTVAFTIALGGMLGILVSISSVGAGALGLTALMLLYPRFLTAKIVGSDLAHAGLLTLVAGLGHWVMGSVDWRILAALLAGSLPGVLIGSYVCFRAPDYALRLVLAIIFIVLGTKLAFDF